MFLIRLSLLMLQGLMAFFVGYLLLLTAMARRAPRRTRIQQVRPTTRFLILIPAHNEELLLPQLLQSLSELDYPAELFAVHVVADNCADQTAAIAREAGAFVHERSNVTLKGKGYALQWLLEEIWASGERCDAIVILDADSVVSANFLRVMGARLTHGERAIQAFYTVRDPGESPAGGLRYAALATLHYLRPQGRMVLGGSAGLKGNGMVFTADIVERHAWSASVTEDIEFHMALILDGERVTFAPDAVVWGQMPVTLDDSSTQNTRWEQGRVDMARRYVPQLLQAAWSEGRTGHGQRTFMLIDAAMEHIIPPFSIMAGATALLAAFSAFLSLTGGRWSRNRHQVGAGKGGDLEQAAGQSKSSNLTFLLSLGLILGQVTYLLAGLRLVRAPRSVYLALLHIPQYVLWKLGLLAQILFGRRQDEWVRTKRNEA